MLSVKLTAALVLGAALCGCSVPMGRSAAAGASSAPLATCSRAGAETPNYGTACVDGREYRCAGGAWQPTALRCEP